MQALKLKLYQNLCNYRKEGSFGYVQTYPLPTPSVIRGMIHEVMDLNEYYSFKVSIQGQSDNITTGMQRFLSLTEHQTKDLITLIKLLWEKV